MSAFLSEHYLLHLKKFNLHEPSFFAKKHATFLTQSANFFVSCVGRFLIDRAHNIFQLDANPLDHVAKECSIFDGVLHPEKGNNSKHCFKIFDCLLFKSELQLTSTLNQRMTITRNFLFTAWTPTQPRLSISTQRYLALKHLLAYKPQLTGTSKINRPLCDGFILKSSTVGGGIFKWVNRTFVRASLLVHRSTNKLEIVTSYKPPQRICSLGDKPEKHWKYLGLQGAGRPDDPNPNPVIVYCEWRIDDKLTTKALTRVYSWRPVKPKKLQVNASDFNSLHRIKQTTCGFMCFDKVVDKISSLKL